jgi:hypothetical protein
MPPVKDLFDRNHLHVHLLMRISANYECIDSLQPSDVDKLGVESSLAPQRASVPESTVSVAERKVNESMLGSIRYIDHMLSLKTDNARDGAMLMLYRRTIITPENLEALFRICDSNIRTGMVRCHAFWHLCKLITIHATWKDIVYRQVDYRHVGSPKRRAQRPLR